MKITTRQVSLTYNQGLPGQVSALQGINIEIEPGACLAISGPSGSGKTTLGLVLAGLLKPTEGMISYEPKSAESPIEPAIVYSPQFPEYTFFCETVKEELSYALIKRNLAQEEIEKRIRKIALALGMEKADLLRSSPLALSKGEARKVGLGIIAVWHPEVMILDEPTISLDRKSQREVIAFLKQVLAEGVTLIIITQDEELIGELAGRMIILNEGKMVWSGKPEDYWSSSIWEIHLLSPPSNLICKWINNRQILPSQ